MTSRVLTLRSAGLLALGWLIPGNLAPVATAQSLLGADPYRPYNSSYEGSSLPPGPAVNFNALNDARSRSNSSRANQMSEFYEGLYGTDTGSGAPRRSAGSALPYSRADRAYDEEFGRVYRPNRGDAQFYQDQQVQSKKYFDALREPDPKKRAEKLKAYEQERLKALRTAETTRRQPATKAVPRTTTPPTTAPRTARSVQDVTRSALTPQPGATASTPPGVNLPGINRPLLPQPTSRSFVPTPRSPATRSAPNSAGRTLTTRPSPSTTAIFDRIMGANSVVPPSTVTAPAATEPAITTLPR